MSVKIKISENRLAALGYIKFNESEKCKMYSLDDDIFTDEYGFSCDDIFETNIEVHSNGSCVMGGVLEIEDFNDLRDVLYKTLYRNGINDSVSKSLVL